MAWIPYSTSRRTKGIAAGITLAIFVGLTLYGTLNGKLKSKISNKLERKLEIENSYRQQFHDLDKNKDTVIDSTEFIYRK